VADVFVNCRLEKSFVYMVFKIKYVFKVRQIHGTYFRQISVI